MDIVKKIIFLCCLSLCLMAPLFSSAAGETLRVGWFLVDGLQDTNPETGQKSGYSYEYLKAISQFTGWNYEFVDMTFSEAMDALQRGDIDLVGGVARLPDRERVYLYPTQNTGSAGPRLVTRADNRRLVFEGLSDFVGLHVGVYSNGNLYRALKQYSDEHQLDFKITVYAQISDMKTALADGTIDAMMVSGNQRLYDMRLLAQLPQQDTYFITSPGKEWIRDGLDKAIGQIKFYDNSFDMKLINKYFAEQGIPAVAFTDEEQAYIDERIREDRPIVVAFDPAWIPVEYRNPQTGELDGAMKGIFQLLEKYTGLSFRFVTAGSYEKTTQRYVDSAEVFATVSYDYDWGDLHNVYLTQPFFDVQIFSIYHKDRANYNVVALTTGYHLAKAAMAWCHDEAANGLNGESTFVYYDTMAECIEAVCRGEAGRTFINAYEVNYYMDRLLQAQVGVQGESGFTEKTSIGISKHADPRLFTIISRALRSIPTGNIDAAMSDYSQSRRKPGLREIIYANPVESIAVSCLLSAVGSRWRYCFLLQQQLPECPAAAGAGKGQQRKKRILVPHAP